MEGSWYGSVSGTCTMGSHTFKGTASAISSILHRMSWDIRCNIDIALDVSQNIRCIIDIAPPCLLTAVTKNPNIKSCPYLDKPGLKVSQCNKKTIMFAVQQSSLSLGQSCCSPMCLCKLLNCHTPNNGKILKLTTVQYAARLLVNILSDMQQGKQ